jgi:hypothetical protein
VIGGRTATSTLYKKKELPQSSANNSNNPQLRALIAAPESGAYETRRLERAPP